MLALNKTVEQSMSMQQGPILSNPHGNEFLKANKKFVVVFVFYFFEINLMYVCCV